MVKEHLADPANDLPAGIGKPARNTLAAAGITRLDHLTEWTEAETLALHGMGPKARGILRAALAAHGQSFRDSSAVKPGS